MSWREEFAAKIETAKTKHHELVVGQAAKLATRSALKQFKKAPDKPAIVFLKRDKNQGGPTAFHAEAGPLAESLLNSPGQPKVEFDEDASRDISHHIVDIGNSNRPTEMWREDVIGFVFRPVVEQLAEVRYLPAPVTEERVLTAA